MAKVRIGISLLASLALTAVVAGEAATPRISVRPPPPQLRVGQEWAVQLSVRGARPSRFVVRLGARVARFPLLRAGRRHRTWVTFPEAGRWRYGVRIGTRDRFVGSVLVRPAVPRLQQPYGIVAQTGGVLLVADYASDAIIRLDPARGGAAIFARIPRPRDLRPAANGTLLVSSGRNVYELDPRTRALRVGTRAASRLEGIAPAPSGGLYVVEGQSRIVHIAADGSRAVLADGLNGVHGILSTVDGVVVCESFAGNVRIVTENGTRTLASGLGNPSYAASAPDGGVYVTEFSANRVSLVERSGAVRALATVGQPGPIAPDGAGRLLVGSLNGTISRIDPMTGRVSRVWPR
jgi:DNA-binding beta-propeller fold protein YncE